MSDYELVIHIKELVDAQLEGRFATYPYDDDQWLFLLCAIAILLREVYP